MRWIALLSGLLLNAGWVGAAEWSLDAEASELNFVASYDGEPVNGRFEQFTLMLDFATDVPSLALTVDIDLASVDTRNGDRDEALRGSDWFAVKRKANAVYSAKAVERLDDGRWRAAGQLELKGIVRSVPIEFTWETDGNRAQVSGIARMVGDAELNRMNFDVGTGDWADPDVIGHQVDVVFNLRLIAKP